VNTHEPLLGAHVSIAGGIENSLVRGEALGCRTVQIFTKSARQWKEKVFSREEIDLFKILRNRTGIDPIIAHNSYLINLAAAGVELYEKSIRAMVHELERCEALGIRYLVIHPGSHHGSGEERGIAKIVAALDRIHEMTQGYSVAIALEIMAGQGTSIGSDLEQIARIMADVAEGHRLVFCLDTCHAFAGGYDVRTSAGYEQFVIDIDTIIGIDRLKVIHVNDSLGECGSRVDRHEDIGKGMIGEAPFRWIMNDARLQNIPKIIETPGLKKAADLTHDMRNLAVLRGLVHR
jgi:deoxyribonuclease-4